MRILKNKTRSVFEGNMTRDQLVAAILALTPEHLHKETRGKLYRVSKLEIRRHLIRISDRRLAYRYHKGSVKKIDSFADLNDGVEIETWEDKEERASLIRAEYARTHKVKTRGKKHVSYVELLKQQGKLH